MLAAASKQSAACLFSNILMVYSLGGPEPRLKFPLRTEPERTQACHNVIDLNLCCSVHSPCSLLGCLSEQDLRNTPTQHRSSYQFQHGILALPSRFLAIFAIYGEELFYQDVDGVCELFGCVSKLYTVCLAAIRHKLSSPYYWLPARVMKQCPSHHRSAPPSSKNVMASSNWRLVP